MRTKILLQKGQSSSLCAFCAHRLRHIWAASHVQRRYLESSSSDPDFDPFRSSDQSSQATWGIVSGNKNNRTDKSPDTSTEKDGFASSLGPVDIAPSWGIGQAPSWASPIIEEDETVLAPALAVNNKKTLEEDTNIQKVASDLGNERQTTRRLLLPPYPGPGLSRQGRPIPYPRPRINNESKPGIRYQKLNLRDEKYPTMKSENQRPGNHSYSPSLFRKQDTGETNITDSRSEPVWGQLKRRVEMRQPGQASFEKSNISTERVRRQDITRQGRDVPPSMNLNYRIKGNLEPRSEDFPSERILKIQPNATSSSFDRINQSERVSARSESLSGEKSQKGEVDPTHSDEGNLEEKEKIPVGEERFQFLNPIKMSEAVAFKSHQEEKKEEFKLKQYDETNKIPASNKTNKLGSQASLGDEKTVESIPVQNIEMSNKLLNANQFIKSSPSTHEIGQTTLTNTASSEVPPGSKNPVKTEASQSKDLVDKDDEEKVRPSRKREKRKRGSESKENFAEEKSKIVGRDRDRARREAKFIRDESEREAARLRQEERLDRQRIKAEKKAIRKAAPSPILLPEFITISNLAVALKIRYEDLATKMKELGFEETHSDVILNSENSGLIAMEYNFEPVVDQSIDKDLVARDPHPHPQELPPRPPVITIMGHVDHGKTTILDYLRKSSVAAGEHGGITQHIGAFSVRMPSGKMMTYLDTPGHAAFLNMRQRGAYVTDIVILVVAADDGVKPQTIEAINHAKAAKVPMIVAINKIDKPDTNIDKVKLELARYGVEIEDFGGDTQVVCISGQTGQGIDKFEENLVALAEIIDMRAEVDGPLEGWVLEASVKRLGKVATVLVRRGTLRPGQVLVAGTTWAKVRALRNEAGTELDEAGPGIPVEVDGWRDQPVAGDEVLQAEDEFKAKRVVDYRIEKKERDKLAADVKAINDVREETRHQKALLKAAREAEIEEKKTGIAEDLPALETKPKPKGPKPVYFIVKGDVSGSVEAVLDQIKFLKTKEVEPLILRSGVGKLSKFDIEHAAVAKGNVISFNLATDSEIYRLAEASNVKIFENNIIYALVDSVRAELSNHLPPLISHSVLGEAEIAQIFLINFKGRTKDPIAGCKVRNGSIKRNGKVRVMRDGKKVFDGELSSLKSGSDHILEASKGNECGLAFEGWSDFLVGDLIQHYEEIYEKRYL
ncbi:Translation initiation factor IF-2 [Golovinomyces cichoracearum]|uniref:Translation initiation factor IF-2, mitochondrial n=1 Tax=Golovinomyces cichoracearum TaxID=62708 RepID=A0A420ILD7_9PEZI|nr:Translation initiation factor IF-2 [Golovinomyces cichoracearum]